MRSGFFTLAVATASAVTPALAQDTIEATPFNGIYVG